MTAVTGRPTRRRKWRPIAEVAALLNTADVLVVSCVADDICQRWDVSQRTAQRWIAEARREGLVQARTGRRRVVGARS